MINKNRFTFNVYGPKINHDYLIDFLYKYQPNEIVVIDEEKLALELLNNNWGMKVIYRKYDPRDGNEWRVESEQSYFNNFKAQFKNKDLVYYIVNEPSAKNPLEYRKMSKWFANVIRLMSDAGYKGVYVNEPVARPDIINLDDGAYDELLVAIDERRDYASFGTHPYTPFGLFMGYGTMDYRQVNNPAHMQKWHTLDTEIYPDGTKLGDYTKKRLPTTYHLLRHHWYQIRATQVLGLERLPFTATEFGISETDDLKNNKDLGMNPYDLVAKTYGIPDQYKKYGANGFYSLFNAYKEWFPNEKPQENFIRQLDLIDSLYGDDMSSFAIFNWETGSSQWADMGFGFANDPYLHELLIDRAEKLRKPPVVVTPEEPPIDVTPPPVNNNPLINNYDINDPDWDMVYLSTVSQTANAYSNVRQTPESPKGVIVGAIYADTPAIILYKHTVTIGKFKWYPIRINTNRNSTHTNGDFAIAGWIRSDVIQVPKEYIVPDDNFGAVVLSYGYTIDNPKHQLLNHIIEDIAELIRSEGIDVSLLIG